MNETILRRRILSLSAIGGVGVALSACSILTQGGTTTVTIDVGKIVRDGDLIVAALGAALQSPTVVLTLGLDMATAEAALLAARAALREIETLTGGSVTVVVDTAQLQALVTSLVANAQIVLGLIQGVFGRLPAEAGSVVGSQLAAALSLIPMVQRAAGFFRAS